ncbi:MAG: Hsp70 family protein [Ruminococcus sp.]|nr:Hsp70 family protein [Ruminococcus sp.]
MGIKVGIDLGTTFCAVAMIGADGKAAVIQNEMGERLTPSVIQFFDDGSYIVGAEAKEALDYGEEGCAAVFKRSMGESGAYCSFYGNDYTAQQLSSIMLRELKRQAEKVTGQRIDEAVVTVPAYFGELQREPTLRAAKDAGLTVRQLVSEPTAAAMNYAADHFRENAKILVYDLGGGTFDLTLVQMKKNARVDVIRTTGNSMLGGKNWDDELAKLLEQKILEDVEYTDTDIHTLCTREAEKVKIALSSAMKAKAHFTLEDHGSCTVEVTREEFDDATAHLREKTRGLCRNLLDGLRLSWRDINAVVLVGGSTRMPQIKRFIKEISGREPLSRVNPDEAVAIGAAIMANVKAQPYAVQKMTDDASVIRALRKGSVPAKEMPVESLQKLTVSDVVAHTLGKVTVNKDGTGYKNQVIIRENSVIPVKVAVAEQFYTKGGEDNESEIIMLQGDSENVAECTAVCRYVVSGIKHDPSRNPTLLKVQYSYDANGIVHVQARQEDQTTDLPARKLPAPPDMSRYCEGISAPPAKAKAEPLRIMMAIDVSGSMTGEPMEEAKNAMCRFIDEFSSYPGDFKIGAMVVSDRTQVVCELTNDLAQCKEAVNDIKVCMTGLCNEADPFDEILNRLAVARGKKVGVVLADGVWAHRDKAVTRARRCAAMGINIIGMGFGEADEEFLKAISSGEIGAMKVELSELTVSFGKIAQELGGGRGGKKLFGGSKTAQTECETWPAPGETL